MTQPNLLFIFSDQHAPRIAGCYGDPVAQTPNLDRLAARGIVFDNCYTPSPICTPARMAMLTGRYPSQQQCWTNEDMLASDIPTWLHAIGGNGYKPTLIGRMHSMGPDQMRGYAERHIGDHSPNWPGIPRHSMGVLDETNNPDRVSIDRSGTGQSAYELLDTATLESTLEWLDQRGASGDNSPFALTVGLMLPHAPFVASREDFARFDGRVPPPKHAAPGNNSEHEWLAWWRRARNIESVPEDDATRARTAYFALTYRMDCMIGAILERLRETGLDQNTLVVYASDHGEQIGERGLWWKHTFFDDSAKVPLIVSWPGRLPQGERRSHITNLIDVSTTLIDLLGAPALPNTSGRSLRNVLEDPNAPWVNRTFSEYCTDPTPAWTGGMAVQQRMIRDGRYKLVYYHGYRPQLFDLESDPGEVQDLQDHPDHAGIRQSLLAQLLADWDPDAIARLMQRRHADKAVIGKWAGHVQPPDVIRWPLKAEHNQLDGY